MVALVGVVLVVLLLHDRKGPRDDVFAYISRVNAASPARSADYHAIERAYRRFQLSPKRPAVQDAQLRKATASLAAARVRLERIPAPPQAARLKRLMIAFLREQESVGRELIGVSTYVPRLNAAEAPLAPASARMRRVLRDGGTATEQSAALDAYAAALAQAALTASRIAPPRIFRNVHAEQVARLRRASALMRRLGVALVANDKPTLQRTVEQLAAVTAPTSDVARRAPLPYTRRVVAVGEAAGAVERERVRLDKEMS